MFGNVRQDIGQPGLRIDVLHLGGDDIPDALLDQLLAGVDPKTAFDPNGLIDSLKKALAERVLNAEMDHHLAGEEPGNRRNGYGKKTVITDTGAIELTVPRDRQASFDPQLIAKYQRRFPLFRASTTRLSRCTPAA
jgi:putative transposase